jgi:dihydroorotase
VSILEVVQGPVTFLDTRNNTRAGQTLIRPVGAVAGGVAFGRPYQSPFAVR